MMIYSDYQNTKLLCEAKWHLNQNQKQIAFEDGVWNFSAFFLHLFYTNLSLPLYHAVLLGAS